MDYQGNSKKSREAVPQKEVQKVVTGKVKAKPKPLGKKVKEIFFGGDARGVVDYVAAEVLFPAMRETIVSVTKAAVERLVFGEERPTQKNYGNRFRSHITYDTNPIQQTQYGRVRANLPDQPRRARASRPFEKDLVFATRSDAEEVVDQLLTIIAQYEVATVADYLKLSGQTQEYTDQNWGWVALGNVAIFQDRNGGFIIDFPQPIPV